MFKYFNIILGLYVFVIPARNSLAQAPAIGLEQVLNLAHGASPENLKAESVNTQMMWKKREAYSGFLPSVSVAGTYLFDKKYAFTDITFAGNPVSFPQIIPTSIGTLTAQLPIFDGFSSTHRLLAASAASRSSSLDNEWTHFKTDREVTLQFYRTLSAQTLKDVAIQNLKILEDHLKDSRLFKKAGLSTNYDVLRVEVQVSEARSEVLNSEDNVEFEKNRLQEILGSDQKIIEIDGSMPVMPDNLLRSDFKLDPNKRADLRAQRSRDESFSYQESAAETYWVPKVSLFYQLSKYNNLTDGFSDWDKYRTAYQLGLTASWNIFDGLSSISKSKQSIEEHKQSEIRTRTLYRTAVNDFEFWKRKYFYFTAVYRARSEDVMKATEGVRLAKEGHKVGARTNTDLLDVELDLFRAKANAVKAQLGAIESLLKLELASGERIYSFY